MARSCKKCLLTRCVPGVSFDENGFCDYCAGRKGNEWEKRFSVTKQRREELKNDMEKYFQSIKGRYDYDCVLGLSGGKDSAYLLTYLVQEMKMKVLAVHVNMHFESAVAEKNLERLKSRLDFDLKTVDPGFEFYQKFFQTLFLNPNRAGYLKSVCYVCGPLYIGFCLKAAVEKKIPLALLAFSPNQPENLFFEWGKEMIEQKDWIPDIFKRGGFDDDFKSHFWNPFRYPEGTLFPRLLAPLHVLPYDSRMILNTLSENGILPKRRLNPAITNCDLNWPMIYLDSRLLGYNPYLKEMSSLVRKGELPQKLYKSLFSMIDWQIKLGIFKKRAIKKIEKRLGIKFSRCPINVNLIQRPFTEYP